MSKKSKKEREKRYHINSDGFTTDSKMKEEMENTLDDLFREHLKSGEASEYDPENDSEEVITNPKSFIKEMESLETAMEELKKEENPEVNQVVTQWKDQTPTKKVEEVKPVENRFSDLLKSGVYSDNNKEDEDDLNLEIYTPENTPEREMNIRAEVSSDEEIEDNYDVSSAALNSDEVNPEEECNSNSIFPYDSFTCDFNMYHERHFFVILDASGIIHKLFIQSAESDKVKNYNEYQWSLALTYIFDRYMDSKLPDMIMSYDDFKKKFYDKDTDEYMLPDVFTAKLVKMDNMDLAFINFTTDSCVADTAGYLAGMDNINAVNLIYQINSLVVNKYPYTYEDVKAMTDKQYSTIDDYLSEVQDKIGGYYSVKEDDLYMREFPYSSVDNLIRLIDSEPEETPGTSVLNSIKDVEDDTDELDDNEDESDNYDDEGREHLGFEEISDSEDIDLPMFTPIRRDN